MHPRVRTSRPILRWPVAASLAALLALSFPARTTEAQGFLGLPDTSGAGKKHVTWQLRVEPATVQPGGRATLIAKYEVAPGWSIYSPDHASSFGLATTLEEKSDAVAFEGQPQFPTPKEKESLGETSRSLAGKGEIRQAFVVEAEAASGELTFDALLTYMACSEALCDPQTRGEPHTVRLRLDAAVATPNAANPNAATGAAETPAAGPPSAPPTKPALKGGSLLDIPGLDLAGLGGGADADTSGPRVAWEVRVEPPELRRGETGTLVVRYQLKEGWHIYSPDNQASIGLATRVAVDSPLVEAIGKPTFPAPKEKEELDEKVRTLSGEGEIRQPIRVSREAPPGRVDSLTVKLDYMPCTELTCDPAKRGEPHTTTFTVADGPPVAATPSPTETLPAETRPTETLPSGDAGEPLSWLLFALGMIGGGLFTLVMPCTYPMIPITISFFTKQAEKRGGNVLPLALAYGAGIILVFNVIGWFFSASIGPFAARPEVNLIFGLAFVAFGLSLLGLFTLRLPASVNALASKAQGSSGYLGVFLLGTTLVITSFTCTAPVLGPLLVFASSGEGFERFGHVSAGMTIFGLTIATPFVLLSLFPARASRMPRAGEWMHTLKVSLGFIELAAALKFLSNAEVALELGWLPRELFLVLWAGIFGVLALYLLELFHLRDETPQGISSFRLLSGLGTACLALYFAWGAIGFKLDWVSEVLVPPYRAEALSLGAGPGAGGGSLDPRFNKHHHASRETVYWDQVVDDLEKGLEVAQREKKLAFINFTGVL